MDKLPIFLDLKGKPCAVIGGGEVAARKVSLLQAAGAQVTVTAPQLCATLAAAAAAGTLVHRAARYAPEALDDAVLVIAATDDRNVNAGVSRDAQARRLPVNVVDDPELCSFIMPAIVDRSPMIIAVSTGGASPVLARLTRARLESLIPAAYGKLAELAERFRGCVKATLPESARRAFWEDALQGPVAELVLSGRAAEGEALLARLLADAGQQAAGSDASADAAARRGEVYLVGAGPGNPDLLTFAALRLMQQADVVLYDNLVAPAIVDLCRRDAERIYVGKRGAEHAVPQPDINRLLVEHARAGRRVLRLKGGDPYVFGRGGEEIGTLAAAGIRFQVIPGVTAATGAASFAGIPLTHRDFAQSCVFVTGHLVDGKLDLDWPALVRPQQTVVVYMGLPGVTELCRQLIAHGRAAETPAALVARATLPDQTVVAGTLATLPQAVAAANPPSPTLIIVGDTVALRDKLAWRG
jgi:uroporphyrin-III C-methyltransferase/precorrin-2 dehydrogenase/sirohydrochlorin ferrochelatase